MTPLVIDGITILVEVEEQPIDVDEAVVVQGELASVEDQIAKLADFGESFTATCVALHRAMVKATRQVKPDEMQLEFGLTLGGEAGIPFVSKGKVDANFAVRLTWTLTGGSPTGSAGS